jgi:hypothetical protein
MPITYSRARAPNITQCYLIGQFLGHCSGRQIASWSWLVQTPTYGNGEFLQWLMERDITPCLQQLFRILELSA